MSTIVQSLQDPQRWFDRRNKCMESARRNMKALMSDVYTFPSEFKGRCGDMIPLPPRVLHQAMTRTDPVVLKTNSAWVQRARRAHRIGMGFDPVIVMEENDQLVPVYVIKPVKTAATWANKSFEEIQDDLRTAMETLRNRPFVPRCKHGMPGEAWCPLCIAASKPPKLTANH